MAGPCLRMTELAVRHLETTGLFYYYIEQTWKPSKEWSESPLKEIKAYMPWWCRMVLENHPEQGYLNWAMVERLENDALLAAPDATELYRELLKNKTSDAVPTLVNRYDAYNKRKVIGPEMYLGERRGCAPWRQNIHTPFCRKSAQRNSAKPFSVESIRSPPQRQCGADPCRLRAMPARLPSSARIQPGSRSSARRSRPARSRSCSARFRS